MNLVTGPTGHIGNVLVRELVRRGEKVRALVLPGEDLTPIGDLDIEIVYGNVLDKASLSNAFNGISNVFHLAGIISIAAGTDKLVHEVNVEGTRNMVETAMEHGVKKFIYTSSIHAFKRIPHGLVVDETTPIEPESTMGAYDRSKAEATLYVLEKAKQGFPAVIACPTGVVGPYDFKKSEIGELVNDWIMKKVNYMIEGSFDFVDVRDVVEGLILARDKGEVGQIYILSGELVHVSDLWNFGQELLSIKTKIVTIPTKLANFAAYFAELYYKISKSKPKFTRYSLATLQSNAVIDNTKARTSLGYKPRSLRESIHDTVKWWKERNSNKKK